MCCQFSDDELLTSEPELFDCGSCAISCHLSELDADNAKAWHLTKLLLTRFVADTQGLGPWLVRLTPDLDEVGFEDLLRRLSLIYDVLVPAPQRRQE